ncbi:MAG: helix-turn-helix domain-containing protein [Bradymonadaceae bacterium]|nr:helix-turn-helix domain-containing protein [Lujinxingiaceae bacterium]
MMTPGTMLREARESKGLTLADVAAITRIPKTMLGHLEHDRFEEYEAEVFVRGHLRNYARELRLDPEAILQSYERMTGKVMAPPKVEERKRMTLRPRAVDQELNKRAPHSSGPMQSIRPSHLVAGVLVLCGIVVMASFLTSSRATAKDPASFPVASESVWEIEQDVEQTRWLLEQPAQGTN